MLYNAITFEKYRLTQCVRIDTNVLEITHRFKYNSIQDYINIVSKRIRKLIRWSKVKCMNINKLKLGIKFALCYM